MNDKKVETRSIYIMTDKGSERVGVAFVNRDGSLTCKLQSLPVNGEIFIAKKTEESA